MGELNSDGAGSRGESDQAYNGEGSSRRGDREYAKIHGLQVKAVQAENKHGVNSAIAETARARVAHQLDVALKAGWKPSTAGSRNRGGRRSGDTGGRPGQTHSHEKGGEAGSTFDNNYDY